MRTGRRQASAVASLLMLACVLAFALPTAAIAKEFSVDNVSIDAALEPNGDMSVIENRTMTFDGDFSRVYWELATKGSEGIEVLGVRQVGPVDRVLTRTDDPATLDSRPEGTYLVESTADAVRVHAFHRTADDTARFELRYRVRGAAQRWRDTGELNWQLLGSGWDVPTRSFSAAITPPAPLTKQDVRAWAHGPLTGTVAITDDGVVRLDVEDVPANTFVEARALYPPEALSEAPLIDQDREAEVLAQEGRLAEEANRQRAGARIVMWLWVGGPLLLSAAALGAGLWVFLRHGREYKAEFQGQYFREDPRPDLHPAVIGALWRFGKVDDVDIAATLMDLADKGVVTMAPTTVGRNGIAGMFGATEQSFTLTRVAGAESKTGTLDRELLDLLFGSVAGGRETFALTEIASYAKANPQTFSAAVKEWKDAASVQADVLGFFESSSRTWQIGMFMMAAVLAVIGVFGVAQTGSVLPLVGPLPVAAALVVMALFTNRRTREGNELYRTYVALRDFLRDFSRLEEAPPSSVILWNRFLVLAVVFGIAEEVIEQLRVKMPELVADPQFQTSYWWVYAGTYGHSPVSSLSTSFVSAASIASSEMSSSSGGGGGFSGGGGFGGGGGGGGAD